MAEEDPITRWQDVAIDDLPRDLPRDLRFRPCANGDPQALTRAQLEAFNRDGFVKGVRVFADEEIAAIRAYFDALLARVLAAGGDAYSINSAHLSYGRVYDLLGHQRIMPYLQDLLGPDLIGWGAHFFCKIPRDPKSVSWHQDASYWPMTNPMSAFAVNLSSSDATRARIPSPKASGAIGGLRPAFICARQVPGVAHRSPNSVAPS